MRVLICLSVLLLSFVNEHKMVVRHNFGVRIGLSNESKVVHFAGFILNDNRIIATQDLTKDDLIRYASGFWPSKFNPKKINFFEKYGVVGGIFTDSISGKKIPYCPTLDSIWKICFSDFPFKGNRERGWSQELYKPSRKQFMFLDSLYGIKCISTNFFQDTMFWKLLQDMNDPNWKVNYITAD